MVDRVKAVRSETDFASLSKPQPNAPSRASVCESELSILLNNVDAPGSLDSQIAAINPSLNAEGMVSSKSNGTVSFIKAFLSGWDSGNKLHERNNS